MLFVMGADGQSVMPERIEAQLWRANPIENFDTAKVDMTFAGGMQAHCLVSHAVAQQLNPVFMYRFEGATVFYAQSCDEHSAALTPEWYDRYDHILARTDDGRVYDYGSPFADPGRKLNQAVEAALQGETGPGPCGIEAASAHVRVINWLQKNAVIRTFAPEQCRKVHKLTYVDGLFERMLEAYRDPSRPLWEDERHA